MEIKRVGVDLAKNVFQLHGVDRKGKTVWTQRYWRNASRYTNRQNQTIQNAGVAIPETGNR